MSKTIQEQINNLKAQFRMLSASRRAAVRRDACAFIARCPHMADASSFWRGLSARQVLAA